MKLLEQYIDCMERGDAQGLADLFSDKGILHDSSLIKVGADTLYLEGKMAVEMMFHHKFGFNGGPFKIRGVNYRSAQMVWYYIFSGPRVLHVAASISDLDQEGKIMRLDIYPM